MVLTIAPAPSVRRTRKPRNIVGESATKEGKRKKVGGEKGKASSKSYFLFSHASLKLGNVGGKNCVQHGATANSCSAKDARAAVRRIIWRAALVEHYESQHERQNQEAAQRGSTAMSLSPTNGQASFPFAVNCKLSKTFFSVPRKCSQCQKLLAFTGYACQFCRFRCHKKCANLEPCADVPDTPIPRPKLCSLSNFPADDELFEQLLRENEVNANDMDVFLEECSAWLSKTVPTSSSCGGGGVHHSESCKTLMSSSSDRVANGQVASLPRSPSAAGPDTLAAPIPLQPVVPRRKTTTTSSAHSRRMSVASLSPPPSNPSPSLTSVGSPSPFSRFWRHLVDAWVSSKEEQAAKSVGGDSSSGTAAAPVNRDSLTLNIPDLSSSSGITTPVRTPVDEFNDSLLDEIWESRRITRSPEPTTSPRSRAFRISESDIMRRRLNWVKCIAGDRVAQSQDFVVVPRMRSPRVISPPEKSTSTYNDIDEVAAWCPDWDRISARCIDEDGLTLHGSVVSLAKPKLNATWPPLGLHINYGDEDDVSDQLNAGFFQGAERSTEDLHQAGHRDSTSLDLAEWTITYSDLEFLERVLECRNMDVFRGRWHGDVMLHRMRCSGGEESNSKLWDEVHILSKIRHENIALFMGASVQPDHFVIITSIRKGDSLFETVHLKQHRLSAHAKVQIARQVTQGLGYLHAKGVVLKTLSSKNVFLEGKVKICMLDYGCLRCPVSYPDRGCIPRGHLSYLSPELISHLCVQPPILSFDHAKCTKESDIFAFGTLLFEMFAGDFPLAQLPAEAVIWLLGSGQHADVEALPCTLSIKNLIEDCWSPEPSLRPSFVEIFKELQHTALVHKKHSSSEPDRLHRLCPGKGAGPYM